MSTYDICLKETRHSGVHESSCPIEDWEKISAYYSDTDELRKMGLRRVEAWLTSTNGDEVLLARWIVS